MVPQSTDLGQIVKNKHFLTKFFCKSFFFKIFVEKKIVVVDVDIVVDVIVKTLVG